MCRTTDKSEVCSFFLVFMPLPRHNMTIDKGARPPSCIYTCSQSPPSPAPARALHFLLPFIRGGKGRGGAYNLDQNHIISTSHTPAPTHTHTHTHSKRCRREKMGNTIPTAATSGPGGAPADTRVYLQNELNRFIITVCIFYV